MHKKFEIDRTKIKGGCQSARKVVTHDSKRDLPLVCLKRKKDMSNLDIKSVTKHFLGKENHMFKTRTVRTGIEE